MIDTYKQKFKKMLLISVIANLVILLLIIALTLYNDLIFQVIGKLFIGKNSFYYNDNDYSAKLGAIIFGIIYFIGFAACISLILVMKLSVIDDKDIVWFVVGKTKREQEYVDLYQDKHTYQKSGKIIYILKNILDYYMVVTLAILCVIFVFSFIAFPAEVNQSSMENTLFEGNRVLVLKTKKVERGDIVVFKYDSDIQRNDPSLNGDLLIKRVIAKENDKFECIDGVIYINDVKLEEEYVTEGHMDRDDYNLSDIIKSNANYQELAKLVEQNNGLIPEGYYVFLGDNRHISNDSENFGLIYYTQISGKVTFYKNDTGWHKTN